MGVPQKGPRGCMGTTHSTMGQTHTHSTADCSEQISVTIVDTSTKREWRAQVDSYEGVAASIRRITGKFVVKRVACNGADVSLASSWRENGVADEATCTAETLTKDEWFRSATPREAATAMVDDMVAINDGLSWLGLPLVTKEELIKRLQIDGDEVKGWDLHDMGLTKLPRRFWDIPMTGRVDLSGNPIKCQCCRAAAGLPLQCEPVGQCQPAFVH